MTGIYLIGLVFMGLGMLVQWRLKSKFSQYSQVPLNNGMSGRDVAEKMLHDNGIMDVSITQVDGQLTDHYNPANKTVNLSADVYNGRSVASTAVAAHECGHAVQHKMAYAPLQLRSGLVPAVNICSTVLNYANMFLFAIMGFIYYNNGIFSTAILGVLVIANLGLTLFAMITLPVEFDASNRALAWIESRGVVNQQEYIGAKDALWWAATTYVVAALGALANLVYYLSIFLNRRND